MMIETCFARFLSRLRLAQPVWAIQFEQSNVQLADDGNVGDPTMAWLVRSTVCLFESPGGPGTRQFGEYTLN